MTKLTLDGQEYELVEFKPLNNPKQEGSYLLKPIKAVEDLGGLDTPSPKQASVATNSISLTLEACLRSIFREVEENLEYIIEIEGIEIPEVWQHKILDPIAFAIAVASDTTGNDLPTTDSEPIDGHSEAQPQSTIDNEERLEEAKKLMEWYEERYGEPTILEYLRYYKRGIIGEIHIEAAIAQEANKARIAGMREITAIGRERLDNDDTYSLDAWIEDSEVYLDQLTADKEQADA